MQSIILLFAVADAFGVCREFKHENWLEASQRF